jgi:hypothetical protein
VTQQLQKKKKKKKKKKKEEQNKFKKVKVLGTTECPADVHEIPVLNHDQKRSLIVHLVNS